MIDIALFPIPRCVSFPGTVFPLHVFEPRYRTMVRHCIEQDMPMGVCHTRKRVHSVKRQQTLEDALHSNQATYKPYPVFSAGRCELVQTLDDGRMLINVHIAERYYAVEPRQTLPFSIYACELYEDMPTSEEDMILAEQLQEKILRRLLAITATDPRAQSLLGADEWQHRNPLVFSFELMGILQLDANVQQQILELRSPLERLQRILDVLNK
jgi:hypothetical protein